MWVTKTLTKVEGARVTVVWMKWTKNKRLAKNTIVLRSVNVEYVQTGTGLNSAYQFYNFIRQDQQQVYGDSWKPWEYFSKEDDAMVSTSTVFMKCSNVIKRY